MKSPFIAILALSLSLWGCAFSKNAGDKSKDNSASPENVEATVKALTYSGELSEKNVHFDYVELEAPGYYTLKVSWPNDVPTMKVSIDGSPYTIVKENTFSMTVLHSTESSIHLVALNSLGGEVSSLAAKLTSPIDLLIEADIHYNENTNLKGNRIYLYKTGRLFTNGNSLLITANKLYLETPIEKAVNRMHVADAHIITTTPRRSAPNARFLSGAQISILAKKAYGHLRIALVGYDGINGTDGAAGEPGVPGAKGSDGIVQYVEDFCVGTEGMPCRRAKTEVVCKTHPTNGLPGGNGNPGGDGTDGTRGGSPGNLSVLVEDSSQFYLEVAQRKGAPGLGGKGGRGGAGGPGGAAGNNHKVCTSARNGNQGTAGIDGKNGTDGAQALLNHIDTDVKEFRSYEID